MTKQSRDRRKSRRIKTLRTWHFVEKPQHFDICCPKCNGRNLDWSEYDKYIWCYDCKEDLNNYKSPLDGPVPVNIARMLGINLDRWDMINKVVISDF